MSNEFVIFYKKMCKQLIILIDNIYFNNTCSLN